MTADHAWNGWDAHVADEATEYIMRLEARVADMQMRLDQAEAKLYDERVRSFALECANEALQSENVSLGARCDHAIALNMARIVEHGTPGPAHGVTLHGMASEWKPGPSGLDEDDIAGLA